MLRNTVHLQVVRLPTAKPGFMPLSYRWVIEGSLVALSACGTVFAVGS
jgi:hypothetical protein